VAPAASITELKGAADEVVCLLTPDLFAAVGDFYEDFHQVADAEVVDYLQRAGSG
jgi:putative phosphoribosyl transferase